MILNELANYARERVEKSKEKISLEEIKRKALDLPRGNFRFEKALQGKGISIISEVKKASPSKGIISKKFSYINIAKEYEFAGATCLSVLTEPKWFLGSDEIFKEIRDEVALPMLRKDFTVDEYQIYESKILGADCILLICALLDTNTIKKYLYISERLGLSVLVETHSENEIQSAIDAGARMIGVNNRNLKDFTVNMSTSINISKFIPKEYIYIAESGIMSPEDGISLARCGAKGLLIGEALMKSKDKKKFIREIKEGI